MSILITDDSTIGDLRVLVDALGDGWSIAWTDTGIALTKPAGVPLHPEAVEELARLADADADREVALHPRHTTATVEQITAVVEAATPHTCGECGKAFAKPHGLEVHRRRTHGPNAVIRRSFDPDAARARAAEAM